MDTWLLVTPVASLVTGVTSHRVSTLQETNPLGEEHVITTGRCGGRGPQTCVCRQAVCGKQQAAGSWQRAPAPTPHLKESE